MLRALRWRRSISRKLQARKEAWRLPKSTRGEREPLKSREKNICSFQQPVMLMGSGSVRDFMVAKLQEGGTWPQHAVQILVTIILSLPGLATERNSSISLNSADANNCRKAPGARGRQKAGGHLVKLKRRHRKGHGSVWEGMKVQTRN